MSYAACFKTFLLKQFRILVYEYTLLEPTSQQALFSRLPLSIAVKKKFSYTKNNTNFLLISKMDRQKALFKFCIFCLNLESTHEMFFFGFSRTNFRNAYFRSRDNVTINIKAGFLQNPNVRDNTFATVHMKLI